MFKPTYKKNAVTRAITTAMPLFLLAGHAAQAHQHPAGAQVNDGDVITVSQGNGRMQVRQLFFQLLGKLACAGFVLMGTGNLLAQCGGVHENSRKQGSEIGKT